MESQPQNPEFRNNPENFHPTFAHEHLTNYKVPAYISFCLFGFDSLRLSQQLWSCREGQFT